MSSSDKDDLEMQPLTENNQDSSAENNHSPHREQPRLAATNQDPQNKQDQLAGKTSTQVNKVKVDPGRRLYNALLKKDGAKFDAELAQLHELGSGVLKEALTRVHGRYTCLQRAAYDGLEREVGELLKVNFGSGSAYNWQDKVVKDDQFSALHYACFYGYHLVLERLLVKVNETQRQIELLETDEMNNTLLHLVTDNNTIRCVAGHRVPPVNRVRCIELLFEYCDPKQKIDVNAIQKQGYTALHNAAKHEDQSMVVPLIKEGANIGIKDNNGKMPVEQIKPLVMEEALDVCVRGSKDPPGDDKFSITFKYDCLVPPGEREALSAVSEMAPLFFLNKLRSHQRLLLHPVLSSFLTVKCNSILPLYWLAVVLYAAFPAILTAYVYLEFDLDPESKELRPSPLVSASGLVAMEAVLGVMLVFFLLLREILEMFLSWRDYLSDPENILQVILIVLLLVMLIDTRSEQTRLDIAVMVIILACIDFVLLLGRHPKLSKYIMMFKTVSASFIKFIILFSFLIFSFSFAFYLLFRTDEHFNTYWLALLKTFVMSTGEMDYNSLDFTHSGYFGRITFFGFLFLIWLVLMNLLNGLAVSDTDKIRGSAELDSLIARVSLIKCLMAVVLGLESVGVGGRCSGHQDGRLKNVRNWLARRVFLFPICAENRSMTVRPNVESSRLFCCELGSPVKPDSAVKYVKKMLTRFCWRCRCHSFDVGKNVVDAANAKLIREDALMDRIKAQERKLDDLIKMVEEWSTPGQKPSSA